MRPAPLQLSSPVASHTASFGNNFQQCATACLEPVERLGSLVGNSIEQSVAVYPKLVEGSHTASFSSSIEQAHLNPPEGRTSLRTSARSYKRWVINR